MATILLSRVEVYSGVTGETVAAYATEAEAQAYVTLHPECGYVLIARTSGHSHDAQYAGTCTGECGV